MALATPAYAGSPAWLVVYVGLEANMPMHLAMFGGYVVGSDSNMSHSAMNIDCDFQWSRCKAWCDRLGR